MIVISYYTVDTAYADEAAKLEDSLVKFRIPHKIYSKENQGSWNRNCHLKPQVILDALRDLRHDILFVDADATFHRPLELELPYNVDWAAHIMDKAYWNQNTSRRTHSLMSGTLFFRNNNNSVKIISKWISFCDEFPDEWDQRNLEKVWTENEYEFYDLPYQYCAIDKTMWDIHDAVIRHHQASRRLKRSIK